MDTSLNNKEIPEIKLTETIKQAKAGNQDAFAQLYEHYFDRLFRFIYYRVSHKEEAEDLTEEVFVKIYQKLKSLKEVDAFEGWMFQVARNQVIDHYRSRKESVDLAEIENSLSYESNIVDALSLEQDQKLLFSFISQLEPEEQVILKLRFIEDLDSDTVAQVLQKSPGNIRVIQHRAINKLKVLVETNLTNNKSQSPNS